MIDVVCDAGSRYVKAVAGRRGAHETFALVAPAAQALDLARVARRVAAALRPGLLEPVRVFLLGDAEAPGPGPGEALSRLGPLSRLAPPRALPLGPVLARAACALESELLVADCGALRTRVFEVVRGSAVARSLENERCTAGAGRFVETMGAALGVGLDQLDACAGQAKDPCRVSSPCPVFAESEVVSQLNSGRAREDVLAGVVSHAVEKVATLVERARPQGRPLLAVGGLARLAVFRAGLAQKLPGVRMLPSPADPLLLPSLAGLAQVQGAAAGQWPQVTLLRWGPGDDA